MVASRARRRAHRAARSFAARARARSARGSGNQPRSYERTEAFNTPLASSAANARPYLRLGERAEHGRQREEHERGRHPRRSRLSSSSSFGAHRRSGRSTDAARAGLGWEAREIIANGSVAVNNVAAMSADNPWLTIPLADDEAHMALPQVGQAQLLASCSRPASHALAVLGRGARLRGRQRFRARAGGAARRRRRRERGLRRGGARAIREVGCRAASTRTSPISSAARSRAGSARVRRALVLEYVEQLDALGEPCGSQRAAGCALATRAS